MLGFELPGLPSVLLLQFIFQRCTAISSANVLTRMGNGQSYIGTLHLPQGLGNYGGPDGYFSSEAMEGPISCSGNH